MYMLVFDGKQLKDLPLQIFDLQIAVIQSDPPLQPWLVAHFGQVEPPQSMSVSSWFLIPSLHEEPGSNNVYVSYSWLVNKNLGIYEKSICFSDSLMLVCKIFQLCIVDMDHNHRNQCLFRPDFSRHQNKLGLKEKKPLMRFVRLVF